MGVLTVRKSWIGDDGPRHADPPVNALLNWSYAVVAGRLAAQLLACGAYLGLGYLRADKLGRYSLVYDAIEVLRPLVDEKVFTFVDGAIFRMGDFQVPPERRRVKPKRNRGAGAIGGAYCRSREWARVRTPDRSRHQTFSFFEISLPPRPLPVARK